MNALKAVKIECRKDEWRMKNTGFQVHYVAMKELLFNYNIMVKDISTWYFSNIIPENQHNPSFLLKTKIN